MAGKNGLVLSSQSPQQSPWWAHPDLHDLGGHFLKLKGDFYVESHLAAMRTQVWLSSIIFPFGLWPTYRNWWNLRKCKTSTFTFMYGLFTGSLKNPSCDVSIKPHNLGNTARCYISLASPRPSATHLCNPSKWQICHSEVIAIDFIIVLYLQPHDLFLPYS